MARFTLHEGDQVKIVTRTGKTVTGRLIKRPYGRRLHGVVRVGKVLHHVPTRTKIVAKV